MPDLQDFNFIIQNRSKNFVLIFQTDCFQNFLLILISQWYIHGNLGNQLFQFCNIHDLCSQIFADLSTFHAISLKKFLNASEHCFFQRLCILRSIRLKKCRLCFEKRLFLFQTEKFCSFNSFYQHSEQIMWKFHNLLDISNRSHLIQLRQLWFFYFRIFLCNEKDFLIMKHCCLNSLDRTFPAHIKVHDHIRKNRCPTERNCRKNANWLFHVSSIPSLSRLRLSCLSGTGISSCGILLYSRLFTMNHFRFSGSVYCIFCDDAFAYRIIRRRTVHQIHQGFFHDGTKSSGAGLTFQGFSGYFFQCFFLEFQLYSIQFK